MADRSPLGLLDTDSLINEEDRAIQQTVRKFVDDRIRPDIAEWYENGSTPVREIARDLGGIGALGHAPRGLRLRRHEYDGLRAGLPGGRGR